jgi:hypothetical protein
VFGEISIDGGLQVSDRVEDAAADALPGHLGKEVLHRVQPGGRGRGEVEGPADEADEEFLRALVRTALQEVLEAEMTDALGAEKSERVADRQGYRSGYYGRTLITRIGKLELRVPQDRTGRFSTELFERYQRSERALVAALAEMYVQGVSTQLGVAQKRRRACCQSGLP